MQRIFFRKSPIAPIPALAAALLAAGVLSVSAPAFAAPISHAPAASAASIADVMLVGGREGKGNRGGGKDRGHRRQMTQGDARADGNDFRRRDGEHRHDRSYTEGRHDRGNHYGWERGKHYGWDKNGRGGDLDDRTFGDLPDWRAERQQSRWMGQDIGRVNSSVLRDYDAYDLPQPGPGQYYARSGNEVYLVTEETRRIMDAFMLRDLVR